ncbi:MAG: hypothetical protein WDN46_23010 [Methylocella sp.]
MTKQEIKWAASHDWFVADMGDGRVLVLDNSQLVTGQNVCEWCSFSSFSALRNFAGY